MAGAWEGSEAWHGRGVGRQRGVAWQGRGTAVRYGKAGAWNGSEVWHGRGVERQ